MSETVLEKLWRCFYFSQEGELKLAIVDKEKISAILFM